MEASMLIGGEWRTAASHEELEVQAARAWSRGPHALGIPAQGPECALIDQVSQ